MCLLKGCNLDIMKYLAAYLLLTAGGKANPSAEDIKSLLSSVGVEAEDDRVSALIAALKDKDVNEVTIALTGTMTTAIDLVS